MAKVNKTILTPENLQEEVKKVLEEAKAEANVAQAAPDTVGINEQTVAPTEPTVVVEANQAEVATEQATETAEEEAKVSDAPVISQEEMQELRQSPLWVKATMANKEALVAMLYESNKPGALEQMAPEIKDKLISANVELIDAFNEVEEAQKKEEELFQYAQSLIEKYGEELKQSNSSSSSSYRSRCGSSSSNTEWYEIAGGVAAGILGGVALYYGGKALYEWGVEKLVDSELDSLDSLSFS